MTGTRVIRSPGVTLSWSVRPYVISLAAAAVMLTFALTGCGDQEKKVTPLEAWASSACVAFFDYGAAADAGWMDLTVEEKAVFAKEHLLAELRRLQAVDREFVAKLETLVPPDTEAGRQGSQLIKSTINDVRQNTDDLETELARARKSLPEDAEGWKLVEILRRTLVGGYPRVAAGLMADRVGSSRKEANGTLTLAFKNADECKSWSTDIEVGESPTLHSLARVKTCLKSKGRNRIDGFDQYGQLQVYLRIRDAPRAPHGAFRPLVSLQFYPTVNDARAALERPRLSIAYELRRIDNVTYGRPPQVLDEVFADIDACIRES